MSTRLVGFVLLFAFVLDPAFAARKKKESKPPTELTAADLLKGAKVPERREFPLSSTVKPCEDFHKYVCGTAEANFKLPKDRARWIFSFSDSSERLLQAKKNYFKALDKGYEPKLERTKNVRSLYKACMNPKKAAAGEVAFVKSHMDQIMKAKESAELINIVNKRIWTPDFNFLSLGQDGNHNDPVKYDLIVMNDGMSLPEKRTYEDKAAVEDLRKLAKAFFQELNLDKPLERADAVVAFEKGFAEAYPAPAEMRKLWTADTYVKRDEIKKEASNFDFDKVFGPATSSTLVRRITKEAMAYTNKYLGEAKFFDLQSVLLFHSLKDHMDDAYPKFFKVLFQYQHKHFGGPMERSPRDERCTKQAMRRLGRELDAELLEVMFPKFDTAKVVETGESVRKAILVGLERNNWLSSAAKKEAIAKTQGATLKMVKPASEADWDFLDLKEPLSETDHIANMTACDRADVARTMERFKKDRNRNKWWMSPLTVNAYYTAEDNQFVLPQGILQYPFFDANMDLIENIAAMGMVVGHELGHGIDDEGSKFDSTGKKRQWMKDSDLKAFEERGSKLIAQFNNAGHDGKLTLGENIGDSVGLGFAIDAAFPKPDEAKLDDVKRFFHSYGRLWCGVSTPEARKMQLKTDPHATNEARINQQVIHKDLFYKAFACKEGDKMYLKPSDRVQVW